LGWAVWPISVEDWEALVEQAAAGAGIAVREPCVLGWVIRLFWICDVRMIQKNLKHAQ